MNLGIKNFYDDAIFVTSADNELDLKIGDKIIFEQKEHGKNFGEIVFVDRKKLAADEILLDGKILRKASEKDFAKIAENEDEAADALEKAREKIAEIGAAMQFVEARLNFEGGEVNFFFTANERIDFKEVVPRLAGMLKKRIHLSQLGQRDRAKNCGGFGICGREFCCSSGVLPKFRSITMDMVKAQELAMKGSDKLSGPCGKLLCCLNYELAEYTKLRKNMPHWGSMVSTEKGDGKIISLDILNQKVKVWLEKGGAHIFPVAEVKILKSKK